MADRRRRQRLLVAAVAAVVVIAGLAAALIAERSVVTIARAEDRRTIASMPLPASGRFEMYFRQSIYDADSYEHFVADRGAGFTLIALRSTNQGVLDYYALEGRRTHKGRWTQLILDEPQHFDSLPVIGTRLGQRTLIVGDRRLPLAGPDGSSRHLLIMVERRPWLIARL
jgi:hypothetical protein